MSKSRASRTVKLSEETYQALLKYARSLTVARPATFDEAIATLVHHPSKPRPPH